MQAKAREEKERVEQAEQRKKTLIETFENLDKRHQEQILDEVGKNLQNNIFAKWFSEARGQGTAHTDPRFIAKFYELLGI